MRVRICVNAAMLLAIGVGDAHAEEFGTVQRASAEYVDARQLLQAKLAERDRLQREIVALRAETKTPEQILVKVKMMEINLTKVRQLGIDYSTAPRGHFPGPDITINDIRGGDVARPSSDASFQMAVASKSIDSFFNLLEQRGLSRILAEPEIVVLSGRPASLHVGGEFPAPLTESRGIEFRKYGTQIDVRAESIGNNRVRVEARPRVSSLDTGRSIKFGDMDVPGLSVREIDTAIEVEAGQTWVISGLVQERTETCKTEAGEHSKTVEIALVVLITPELVR